MVLNGAAIRAASIGFQALFTEGWDKATTLYEAYSMMTESKGEGETYDFTDELPAMREWLGDRQVKNLGIKTMSLDNREWELTIGVKRSKFEDDTLGSLQPRIRTMGVVARTQPDDLIADLLNGGFAAEAYDGENFFSTDHEFGSNKVTGALATATFNTAIQQMRKLTSHDGERKINVWRLGGELHLMVAADLESTGRQLLLAAQGSGGATNTDFGRAKLVVNPQLEDGYWFLIMANTGGLAPFVFQMRKQPRFVSRDQPSDESVWTRNEVEYGVDGRWAMGYGLPQLIQGSNGS